MTEEKILDDSKGSLEDRIAAEKNPGDRRTLETILFVRQNPDQVRGILNIARRAGKIYDTPEQIVEWFTT